MDEGKEVCGEDNERQCVRGEEEFASTGSGKLSGQMRRTRPCVRGTQRQTFPDEVEAPEDRHSRTRSRRRPRRGLRLPRRDDPGCEQYQRTRRHDACVAVSVSSSIRSGLPLYTSSYVIYRAALYVLSIHTYCHGMKLSYLTQGGQRHGPYAS